MNGEKSALGSIGIWGSIIAFIPAAAQLLDRVVASGVLAPKEAAIVSGVGAVIAFVGRWRAKKEIKGVL